MFIPVNMLKAVALAAGQKDIRSYLNGVLVEVMPTHTVLVATDGYRMHFGKIAEGSANPFRVIVPNYAIQAATMGKVERVDLTRDEHGRWNLGNVGFKEPDGVYPEWRRVLGGTGGQGVPSPINRAYIADVAKAAMLLAGKRCGVVVHNQGNRAVYKLTDRNDFMALVMSQSHTVAIQKDALANQRWIEAHEAGVPAWLR